MMFLDCFKFFLIVSEFLNTTQRSIVIELALFVVIIVRPLRSIINDYCFWSIF